MTREEIKKAIENGESVWCVLLGRVEELKDLKFVGVLLRGYNKIDLFYHDITSEFFDGLYKTKAEAEHYLHHTNITRTEQLPFLTWEEFKGGEEVIFKGRNGKGYALVYNKGLDKIDLFDTDGIMWGIIESWDLTEANFYKAYDECVRLFKGE